MEPVYLATFFVALLSSIISGMSGGGGGFVMTPYYLLIGLTPQQIVAGASVASLGLGSSSLVAMRGTKLLERRFLWPLLLLTIIATSLAMTILPKVQSDMFELAIGLLLICLAPTLFMSKAGLQARERSRTSIFMGYGLYGIILFASSLGTGLATLLFLPLIFLMGLSVLQANALRRVLMLVQAVLTFCLVISQGYIIWSHALAALIGCYLGGFIGTKVALKKGEVFAKASLVGIMVISGVALLLKV